MAELKPHEQRVVAEYKELRERHAKLYSFIASGAFITLPEEDRELMVIQENLMDALSFVLARRIRRFSAAAASVAAVEAPSTKPCPECSGGSPGLVDDGSGGFATCEECGGTGRVPLGVLGTFNEQEKGLAACPTSRGKLLEIEPNDRRPEESHRGTGEEKQRGEERGRSDAACAGGAELGARGSNAAQHEVRAEPGPSAPATAGVPAAPAPDQYGTALATMPKTAEEVAWLRPCSLGACPQPEVCGKRGSCAERGGQQ